MLFLNNFINSVTDFFTSFSSKYLLALNAAEAIGNHLSSRVMHKSDLDSFNPVPGWNCYYERARIKKNYALIKKKVRISIMVGKKFYLKTNFLYFLTTVTKRI